MLFAEVTRRKEPREAVSKMPECMPQLTTLRTPSNGERFESFSVTCVVVEAVFEPTQFEHRPGEPLGPSQLARHLQEVRLPLRSAPVARSSFNVIFTAPRSWMPAEAVIVLDAEEAFQG